MCGTVIGSQRWVFRKNNNRSIRIYRTLIGSSADIILRPSGVCMAEVVCGGTGLWIESVVFNHEFLL